MTKLYLDTEYNGFGGKLISMALVGHKAHWYQARMIRGSIDPWVKEYVMPVLDTKPVSHDYFRAEFQAWITQFDNPEIICDWHADAEHFCYMLRGADHESSLDYPCSITILKTPPGQPVSAKPHNALADATALRGWHTAVSNELARDIGAGVYGHLEAHAYVPCPTQQRDCLLCGHSQGDPIHSPFRRK